jgi:hypothetical protein
VRETDARLGLPAGTAAAVDAMHSTPVMRNRLATARFLALDLFAAGAVLVAALVGVLVWSPARTGLLAALGVVGALGLVLYVGSLRFRRVTEAADLHRTAERLAELFKVRYVVFGHSHAAGTWPLGTGGTYVNVGTWVPEGEESFFVFFVLRENGGTAEGALWRWNKRARRPEPLAAGR